MTIISNALLAQPTMTFTSGTSVSVKSLGNTLRQSDAFIEDGSNMADRYDVRFVVKPPKISSNTPSGYTQARATFSILKPRNLANGNRTTDSLNLTLSVDVNTTDAEKNEMLAYAAQVLGHSDFADFWQNLSLA